MVRSLLFVVIMCSAVTLHAQTRALGAQDSSVNAMRALYEKGAYIEAEVEARRFLEQRGLPDSLRTAAEQYLAFALVAQGKPKTAVIHFSAILDADSTFELDPLYTSPKIMAALNEAKQLRQSHAKPAAAIALPVQTSARAEKSVSWRTVVFPGWEQIHQGRETAGYVLLGAGTAAIALAAGFEISRASARSEYLSATTMDQAAVRYDRYNRAHKAEVYSLITFTALYFYSQIDAFVNLPHSDAVSLTGEAGAIHLSVRF